MSHNESCACCGALSYSSEVGFSMFTTDYSFYSFPPEIEKLEEPGRPWVHNPMWMPPLSTLCSLLGVWFVRMSTSSWMWCLSRSGPLTCELNGTHREHSLSLTWSGRWSIFYILCIQRVCPSAKEPVKSVWEGEGKLWEFLSINHASTELLPEPVWSKAKQRCLTFLKHEKKNIMIFYFSNISRLDKSHFRNCYSQT